MTITKKKLKQPLQKLICNIDGINIPEKFQDIIVNGISLDSREIEDGYLFAAFKGAKSDGASFIPMAIEKGAKVILCDEDVSFSSDDICVIKHKNPRRAFSLIVANFYEEQPDIIAAITGTNGKTSTAHFTKEIWRLCKKESASIGTLGVNISGKELDEKAGGSLTTPDTVKMHKILAEMKESGINHLALEASSHGLDQFRLDGIRIRIAAFTNLSRDHLDYHETLEKYLAAKMRLFSEVITDDGVAVINADVPEYEAIMENCKKRNLKTISYGRKADYIKLLNIMPTREGMQISLQIAGKITDFTTHLIGDFQAYNLLCAFGIALASGISLEDALTALPHVTSVPGRMESVAPKGHKFRIFVDYAHTPDALEKALLQLKPYTKNSKLWVVFGCGGDRDKGKRPIMGEIASKIADYAVVTDDNPRTEDANQIRREIMASCKNGIEIADRANAIAYCISKMEKDDILLIAGKGHEKTQKIGDKEFPFDDVAISREFLN